MTNFGNLRESEQDNDVLSDISVSCEHESCAELHRRAVGRRLVAKKLLMMLGLIRPILHELVQRPVEISANSARSASMPFRLGSQP